MPTTTTLDIRGSSYSKGVFQLLLDSATRMGVIEGLEGDSSDFVEARDDAITAAGGVYHPLDSTLPLQVIHMRKFGPNSANLRLEYRRRRLDNVVSSQLLARFRVGPIVPVRWYSQPTSFVGGLPSGDPIYIYGTQTDQFARAVPWTFRRKAVEIAIPTTLTENPTNQVYDIIDTVCAEAVTAGTYTFNAGEIRFDGVIVDHRYENEVDQYDCWYRFTALRGGFFEQYERWNSGSLQLQILTQDLHESTPKSSWTSIPFTNGGIT